MGGEEIVSGIVEEFVSMVIEDDKLKSHFEGVDQEKMKVMLVAQITYASGGEIEYEGETFLESLAGMGITGESLESVTEHMTASMETNDAWPEDVDELLVVLDLLEKEHELIRIEGKQDSVSVRYEMDTSTSTPAQKE
jgi:truncated hemoglobin YjbI